LSEDAAVCKKKEDEIPEYSDKIIVIGDSATVRKILRGKEFGMPPEKIRETMVLVV